MKPSTLLTLSAALAACSPETDPGVDAGASPAVDELAVVAAPALRAARVDDLMTPGVPLDDTVIVPFRWHLPIQGAGFDGGRHYVVGTDWMTSLSSDGMPADRNGFDLSWMYGSQALDARAVTVADGRLVMTHASTSQVTLQIQPVANGAPVGASTLSWVHGANIYGARYSDVAFGADTLWVVYNQRQGGSGSGSRIDDMMLSRVRLDGVPIGTPVRLGSAAWFTRPRVTFAGDRAVVAWPTETGVAIVRIGASGQVLDTSPIVLPGATGGLRLIGNDRELLIARAGSAQRLSPALVAAGDPVTYTPGAVPLVARTSRGFRLVWVDGGRTHVRDLPTGAAAEAEILADGASWPSALSIGPADQTVLVYSGSTAAPPSVTRLRATGELDGSDVLRETQRTEGDIYLAGENGRYAARWHRYSGGASEENVEALVGPTGERLTEPRVLGAWSWLLPRTGGFWRMTQNSAQAVDADLAPAGAPITFTEQYPTFSPLGALGLVLSYSNGTQFGRRLDASGYVDAAPFPIAGDVGNASLIAGDREWLMTWCWDGALRGTRISAAGEVLDLPPRSVDLPDAVNCWGPTGVALRGGDYVLAWTTSQPSDLWTATLRADGSFTRPQMVVHGSNSLSFRLVADGDTALLLSSSGNTGALRRLRGDGTRFPEVLESRLYPPYTGIVRTAPGRFLVIASGPWTEGGVTAHRLLRHELVLGAPGAACDADIACANGVCADGVCCDRACGSDTSDCQACSVAAGAPVDGVCAPRVAGTECRAATYACDAVEVCDGNTTACPADGLRNSGTCDDRNGCTTGDTCQNGACVGAALDCPAPDECHTAWCQNDGCVSRPVDDGTRCSGGECRSGACVPAPDAGAPDAGLPDAGAPDAGASDARVPVEPRPMPEPGDDGCGCRAEGRTSPVTVAIALLVAAALRRRRRRS